MTSQSPQLSSLLKKKASTILPRTPSPPLNKLPSSQPIIHTSIPPSQETLRHLPPLPPSPPPTSHLTTSLPPSPPPISHLTTLHQPFPPSSTIPSPITRYHPHNPNVVTLLLISSPTPISLPSGNLSHWTVIQARLHFSRCRFLQGLPYHPQRPHPRMVYHPTTILHRLL